MCGILCLYNKQRNVLEDCGKFNQMLHLLEHRGPDDSRTYFDSHVLLGHCRLSIIDLNEQFVLPDRNIRQVHILSVKYIVLFLMVKSII